MASRKKKMKQNKTMKFKGGMFGRKLKSHNNPLLDTASKIINLIGSKDNEPKLKILNKVYLLSKQLIKSSSTTHQSLPIATAVIAPHGNIVQADNVKVLSGPPSNNNSSEVTKTITLAPNE